MRRTLQRLVRGKVSAVRVGELLMILPLAAACTQEGSGSGSVSERASRSFGLHIERVSTLGARPRFESCLGEPALVVPPNGVVELPVSRGFHTLSGTMAICDPVGAAPVEFRVELSTPSQVLLVQRAATVGLPPRDAYPFLVTFWAEAESSLLLRTSGDQPDVPAAWLDLGLGSRRFPQSRGTPPEPGRAGLRDDGALVPPHLTRPGRRARAEPLLHNALGTFWLADWGWSASSTSWGPIEIDRANGSEAAFDGSPLSLKGRVYAKGIGMHAPGRVVVDLLGRCRKFAASVGIDDAVGERGSAVFMVTIDGEVAFQSEVLRGGGEPARLDVPLFGKNVMFLDVDTTDDGAENDWTNWADAQLDCDP